MSRLRTALLPHAPDHWILLPALLILALGLVMVASASFALAEQTVGNAWHFVARQSFFAVIGLVVGYLLYRLVSIESLQRAAPVAYGLAAVLLLLVLLPGLGYQVKGSFRWLDLGPVRLQVSEVAKLLAIIYLAAYVARHGDDVRHRLTGALRPMLALGLLAGLALAEPDLGAAGVLLATGVLVLFLAGIRLAPLLIVLGAGALALGAALYMEPYRLARLESFLDPWKDPYGVGFQLTQSLIAIGRGELFGAGLGLGLQKLFYLPEAHTDFIFAVLAEELGLLGVCALCALYGVLVGRCFIIGRQASLAGKELAAALCFGVGAWFALQALINAGVNLGILPTKGLTLPLVSYGGSSLLMMLSGLALVLRAELETRAAPARKRARGDQERGTLMLPVRRGAAR